MSRKLLAAAAVLAAASGASAIAPFEINVGGTTQTFNAFEHAGTAASWYGYGVGDGSSANPNPDVRRAGGNVVTLVSAFDGLHLVLIEGKPGTTGGTADISIDCGSEACSTAGLVVADDPPGGADTYDFDENGNGSIHFQWAGCCTDGVVYGPFKAETCFALEVQLTASEGVDATYIASSNGDGTANVFVAGNANDLIRFEGCSCPAAPACEDGELVDTDGDSCLDTCRRTDANAKHLLCDGGAHCSSAQHSADAREVTISWGPDGDAEC